MTTEPHGGPNLAELAEIIHAYDDAIRGLQASHDEMRAQATRLAGELARKNAELEATVTQVSALKNTLANIIESNADGLVAVGPDLHVSACNRAAADMLGRLGGLSSGRPEGKPAAVAVGGPCRELGDILLAAAGGRRTSDAMVVVTDPAGNERILSVSAGPIRSADADGRLGAVETFRDVTDVRALEARANRHERLAALGEMAAGVAHEIRNPLGGIELFASTLARKFPDGAPERGVCDKIIAAAQRLERIVTDMLTFARGPEARPRPAEPERVVRAALELAAAALEAKAIRVEVDFARAKGRFPLDPDLLTGAFLNVVRNAAQAMGEGGCLAVSGWVEDDRRGGRLLAIRFADNGPGIPPEAREKVFHPFYTLRKDGTGLGLAIVHKIAQEHGGSVTVDANIPRGAAFTFRFPAGR